MFTAVLFTKSKLQKQYKYPSMNEWIQKMWCVCVFREQNDDYQRGCWDMVSVIWVKGGQLYGDEWKL